MDLAALKEKRVTLTVPYGEEEIKFQIRPHVITPAYRAAFREKNKENDNLADVMVQSIADVVAAWEITTDGAPLAVTTENVKQLPESLVVAIWNAVDDYLGKLIPERPKE